MAQSNIGKPKVLITGGAGFVGVNLVDYLLKQKRYRLLVADNLSTGSYGVLQKIVETQGYQLLETSSPGEGAVGFIKNDIVDRKWMKVIDSVDYLVHLAAQTGVIPSMESPMRDADINIKGTLNLLEASKGTVKKFLYASSAAPLGEQVPPLDELKIPRPLSPYGASKLAGEAYCSAYQGSFGLETLVFRFSNLYGPHSFHKGSVVAHFIKMILQNQNLTVYGDGEQTRDFLYVDDISAVIDHFLSTDSALPDLLQLGTGIETSINKLIELLGKVSGRNLIPDYLPARRGEIRRNYTSIERLKKAWGRRPQVQLERGLAETWNWYLNNFKNLR